MKLPIKIQTFWREWFGDFYINAWRERGVLVIGPIQILRRATKETP